MKTLKLLVFGISLAFFPTACSEDETPDPDKSPVTTGDGCYLKNILNDKAAPLFSYFYLEESPSILDFYYEHDPLSSVITNTYSYRYSPASIAGLRIDSVFHYIGDFYVYGPGDFSSLTVYYYTSYGNSFDVIDSANVYVNTYVPEEPFGLKGTIYYEYESNGLLETETYYDNEDYSQGSFYDNYQIQYFYDSNAQLIEWKYFNYDDKMTYYEKYELTTYFQPSIKVVVNPELVKSNLYAPAKLTVPAYLNGGLNGTYTYKYQYQVNEHNYIVEQSLLTDGGNAEFLKLLTYDCYYD